jgi:hypothetical protein
LVLIVLALRSDKPFNLETKIGLSVPQRIHCSTPFKSFRTFNGCAPFKPFITTAEPQ